MFRSTRSASHRRASVAWVLLLAGVTSLAGQASAAEGAADLGPVLEPVRAAAGIPGVSAAVARDGVVIARGTAGVRALGDPTPVAIDDRFLIGSCAKAMLRLLVARLVDAGVLGFDTRLGDALQDVPMRPEYKSVTLAQALAFRGGIPPYTEIGPKLTPWLFELTGTPEQQRVAFATHVLGEAPAAPPGTREIYSNAAYGIVAHVAERRAGKPWETLIAEQVFQPLGMTTARVGPPTSEGDPNGTRGHFRTETGYALTPGPRKPLAPIAPAGLVSCSVSDFARFAGQLALIQAGHPGGFLKPDTAARLVAIGPVDPQDEGVLFFGGEGTFTAAYALWPSHQTAIVVQTNGGDADPVCRALVDAVRAAAVPEIQAPAPPIGPLGLAFAIHSDDDWEITDVKAGSPAAAGGLAKGDRLVALNGVPVEKMSLPERKAALAAERIAFTVRRGERNVACAVVVPGRAGR